jgi:cytochrome c556
MISMRWSGVGLAAVIVLGLAAPGRTDSKKLPPGPIKDRIELMEQVGDSAKTINDALKAGKPADTAAPADQIAAAVPKLLKLFPPGSESPDSRAKPAIWTSQDEFDAYFGYLEKEAKGVAAAARSGGDVKAASRKLYKTCKSCHTKFRQPKEGED